MEKRLSAPSTTDKNYRHTSSGGYNPCIHISGGSCLPNCVGYAWGRWRELLGKSHNLSKANAELWWGNSADGYKRGSKPELFAVICWSKGKVGKSADGAGHVAIVEDIAADGTIITSNSGYGSKRFYTQTLKPPYSLSGYKLQGFIYLPIDKKEDDKMTAQELKEFNNLKARVAALETQASPQFDTLAAMPKYAKPTVEKLIKKGYLQGTGGALDLSTQLLRLLVILDRSGAFDK